MNVEIRDVDGAPGKVLAFSGEVGFSEVPQLKSLFDEVMTGESRAILVDLGDVNFIASDGLGAFIRARANAEERGKAFFLVQPQPRILELLRKTQLTRIFTVCPSVADAMGQL